MLTVTSFDVLISEYLLSFTPAFIRTVEKVLDPRSFSFHASFRRIRFQELPRNFRLEIYAFKLMERFSFFYFFFPWIFRADDVW